MLDVSFIQFCSVWNKTTIFNMHHIIKAKMNVIDITSVFFVVVMSIPSLFTAKKSCNILWIMHELCQCLIFFFLNFHFKILLWNPFVFPTCFLHYFSFEKNPSWFITYNVVTSMLVLLVSSVLVHVWMSDSMLDSQCNIFTSLSSL